MLSLIRIGMVYPILFWIANEEFLNALALFIVASLSDALDGFLARRYNWHTSLGKLLDPIADKALLIGTIIILWISGNIPLVVVILFLLRDALILIGAAFQMTVYEASTPSPNFLGKVTTISQIIYLVLIFRDSPYFQNIDYQFLLLALFLRLNLSPPSEEHHSDCF